MLKAAADTTFFKAFFQDNFSKSWNLTLFSTRMIMIYKLIKLYNFCTSFILNLISFRVHFNEMLKTNLAWLCLRFLTLKQKQQHFSRRSCEKINKVSIFNELNRKSVNNFQNVLLLLDYIHWFFSKLFFKLEQ